MTNPTWIGQSCQIQSCEKQSCQMYHGWCDRGNTTGEVIAFDNLGQLTSPPPLIQVTIPRRSRDRLETDQGSQTIRVHNGLIGTRSVA